MKHVTSSQDIARLGTILGVWAHPDDETICCGGLMSAARANGQRVVCLTATKGEAGVQDENRWPRERLGEIRAEEMKAALAILGIDEQHWLGCSDGCCPDIGDESGAKRVATFITDVKPDTILTFPPSGLTGHPDHQAVSRWVKQAVLITGSQATVYHVVNTEEQYEAFLKAADEKIDIYFAIDKPELVPAESCDILFQLSDKLKTKKIKALRAMPSQYEGLFAQFSEQWARGAFGQESFVQAHKK